MDEHYEKPTIEDEDELPEDIIFTGEIRAETPALEETMPSTRDTGESFEARESGRERLADDQMIIFKDALGRRFNFPFAMCRTWHGMEELIDQAISHLELVGKHVKAGHFDLLGPDGSIVLPSVWEKCVKPGWFVTMRMWQDFEDDKNKEEEAIKKGNDKAPILFKDAVGRKFSFPFRMCQTWLGMEELVKQAFLHVDVIGPHVQAGHYDLLGPDQQIILPQVWDKMIQPDWAITMVMWPMDRARPGPPPGRFPQNPGLRPPDVRPGPMGGPSNGRGPPPPPPGLRPGPTAGPSNGPPPPPPPGSAYPRTTAGVSDIGERQSRMPDNGEPVSYFRLPLNQQNQKKSSVLGGLAFGEAARKKKMEDIEIYSAKSNLTNDSLTDSSDDDTNLPLDISYRRTGPVAGGRPLSPVPFARMMKKTTENNDNRSASEMVEDMNLPQPQVAKVHENTYLGDTGNDTGEIDRRVRQEAKEKKLIVTCKRQSSFDKVRRQQTFTASVPSWHLAITSARTYWQGSSMLTPATLELFHSTKSSTPPTTVQTSTDRTKMPQMKWIHAVRPSMRFQEFEYIALEKLCPDLASRQIVSYLVDTLRNKKRDDKWTLKPGTILRCDTDTEEEEFRSVCFVSVPTLHSSLTDRKVSTKDEEICREQKLHEALGQRNIDPGRRDLWSLGRKSGKIGPPPFWVRQSWVLITSAGVLTYSSHQQDILRGTNITIQEDSLRSGYGEQMIQVMDEMRRLFYLPTNKCKGFYELEVTAREELIRTGTTDLTDTQLQFELPDKEILTTEKWAEILKLREFPSLRILRKPLVEPPNSGKADVVIEQEDTSDSSDSEGSSDIYDMSVRSSELSRKSSSDTESQATGTATKTDEKGFIILPFEKKANDHHDGLPELNKKTPPFLSWLSEAQPDQERNINKAFTEGIIRTEEKLSRLDGKAFTGKLMEDLFQALGNKDIYHETAQLSFDDFQRLSTNDASASYAPTSSSSAKHCLNMANMYFEASLRVLESFISAQFRSTLVAKYLSAISMFIKDPTRELHPEGAERAVDDPEPLDTPAEHNHAGWVVSRTVFFQDDRVEYHSVADDNKKCKDCDKGVIYHSLEEATAHLRRSHLLSSATEARLRHYVVPVASAIIERRQEDQSDLLKQSRDAMDAILRKLVYIQNCVVSDDGFREQRGLPHHFIEAFRWIVIYVCTVPHIFHRISCFCNDDPPSKSLKHLTDHKIRRQVYLLSQVRVEAEAQIRQAERVLMSPDILTTGEVPDSFLFSVGPHYLALQIILNLLKMPVQGQKRGLDLYDAYANDLVSQVRRRPNQRQLPEIRVFMDDLALMKKFYHWQLEALCCFALTIAPATYPKSNNRMYAEREKLYAMESDILHSQIEGFEKEIGELDGLFGHGTMMSTKVKNEADIKKDDQSQVIFIFTAVTVVFLPLSFVASYISMSGGTTGLDWTGLQILFWKVSGPLTIVVIVFCLAAAQTKRMMEWIGQSSKRASRDWNRLTTSLLWTQRSQDDTSDDDSEITIETATSSSRSRLPS